jgi:hypothetical protein
MHFELRFESDFSLVRNRRTDAESEMRRNTVVHSHVTVTVTVPVAESWRFDSIESRSNQLGVTVLSPGRARDPNHGPP